MHAHATYFQKQYYLDLFKKIPKPFGEKVWVDYLYLYFIYILQTSVLVTFVSKHIVLDLVTPWLAIGIVMLTSKRSLPLTLVSAVLIETNSVAPSGIYVTAYWILATAITVSRNAISWNAKLPWITLVLVSELWMCLSENLIAYFAGFEVASFTFIYSIQAIRILFSVVFGYMMANFISGDLKKDYR